VLETAFRYALQEDDGAPLHVERHGWTLSALNGVAKIRLQLRQGAELDIPRLSDVLELDLPTSVHRPAHKDGALWLAPNDWLLPACRTPRTALEARVAGVVPGMTFAVTDVSDSLALIELSGPRAADLLAQACSLDLHERAFPVYGYALTRLESQAVIVHKTSALPVYRLYVERSAARFLWDWLLGR